MVMHMRVGAAMVLVTILACAAARAQTAPVPPASGGVIQPPAQIDPGIKVAPKLPPAALPTPVIPPPGTAGGNPAVQPK